MEKYVKYVKYILLPSYNMYKIESYALTEKINNLWSENTIALKIMDGKVSTFLINKLLLNIMIYESSENVPEIIMEMKKHGM